MILSGPTIRKEYIVHPHVPRTVQSGMSYGESYAGYDIRVDQEIVLSSGQFKLASSMERFSIPKDVVGMVKDKSTWARRGLSVFNTIIEPGWQGFLTLELFNTHTHNFIISEGDPIAQVLFYRIDAEVNGYEGKYQGQGPNPVSAKDE